MNTRPMDPILLVGAILLFAAALTWVVPAGRYQRRHDPNTRQNLVVPGSYRSAPRQPVGAWGMLLAVPEGLAQAAAVVFYCFLAGGALTVIEKTGAIGNTLDHLVSRFGHRRELILLLITTLFLVGGACYGMYEEIIAFLPLLCGLMARIGLDGETALALSVGSACVAGSFSPFNTFTLGISQPMAELPLFSGFAFRTAFFVAAVSIWIVYVLRHARR